MPPAPVNLVIGEEELLVERSVSALLAGARESSAADPAAGGDVHDVAGGGLAAGELASLTSPSLFGGGGVVVIRAAQDAGKDVADEIARYAADPAPDVVLILTHAGGGKGKALLTALKKTSGTVAVTECPKVTRFSDKLDFTRGEFRRAGKVADEALCTHEEENEEHEEDSKCHRHLGRLRTMDRNKLGNRAFLLYSLSS